MRCHMAHRVKLVYKKKNPRFLWWAERRWKSASSSPLLQTIYEYIRSEMWWREKQKCVEAQVVRIADTSSRRADGEGWTVPGDIESFLPRCVPLSVVRILSGFCFSFFLNVPFYLRDKPKRWTPKPIAHFYLDIGNRMRYGSSNEIVSVKKKRWHKVDSKVKRQTDDNQQQPWVIRATTTASSTNVHKHSGWDNELKINDDLIFFRFSW